MIFQGPYASPYYFILFAAAVIPVVIMQMLGKRCEWYQALLTIFFLSVSFGGPNIEQGIALVCYIIYQTVIQSAYFAYRKKRNNTFVFIAAVIFAIIPLFLIKLTEIVPDGTKDRLSLIGFLGISYLTFKAVQVVIETRDGLISDFRLWHYIRFLTFWPTISAGPIDRYRRFVPELTAPADKMRYAELFGRGVRHIFTGFLYNYIIAFLIGRFVLPVVSDYALHGGNILAGTIGYMYVYSAYLFFDFAGYSRMAIGVSYLLGYETPPNFNLPFLSYNIKDFWNRWHMSLSFWFRDYIYMRLLMTFIKKKVFKSRIVTSNICYFALFLLMGAWHGFTWYYIAYGLYHATLICLTDVWLRFKKKHTGIPSGRLTHIVAVFLTIQAVCISFLIFSGFLDTLITTFVVTG
ncbi:MAG: D-alanyl-lipoteichoic acid biosynthesis protein DltB [Clostridiales Family XIII bacterium]|jgi:membrane protein involved in D-alanine export|nr:D-alanyl-lipoteichoic acid biosynthesis protein DltB [Clostridiales Family XIII bacterium]